MKKYVSLLLASVFLVGCGSNNPREIVRKSGYLTTVPPSTSYGPGSIVWKKTNNYNHPEDVSLGYICSPEYVKFPGEPEKGIGEISDFGTKKEFNFTGQSLKTLGLSTSAKYVSNLTIRFSNIEYLEYGLDKLETIQSNLGPECRKILKKQRDKNNAHIVRSAFKADLDYTITYNATANTDVKIEVLKEIEAKFGLSLQGNKGSVGRGLYYGVAIDPL